MVPHAFRLSDDNKSMGGNDILVVDGAATII